MKHASNLPDDYFFKMRVGSMISLVFSILFIFYIERIRRYLNAIDSCSCAPLEYVHNIAKLETVFLYVLYIMCVVYSLHLVYPQWITVFSNNTSEQMKMFSLAFLFLFQVALVLLSLVFVYNVYEYYINVSRDCGCIDQIDSLMMYLQSLFYLSKYIVPAAMFIFTAISLYVNRRSSR